MLNFIIWDGSPVVFSIGPFVLRWYIFLFIVGFVIARLFLLRIFKKEGNPSADVEALTIYILVGALIGARLGYVLLYEPNTILTKPIEAFFPFHFKPSFRFMGIERLSGFGAIIGIMGALWLFSLKKRAYSYLHVIDRVVMVIALTAVFIGVGNFLNAEIIGKPTSSSSGVVFARPVMDDLMKLPCCIMRTPGGPNPLQDIEIKPDTALHPTTEGHSAVILYLFFKGGNTETSIKEFLIGDVKTFLYDNSHLMYEPGDEPLHYTIFQESQDVFTGRIRTTGIARFPVQLFEAGGYLLLLVLLFVTWRKNEGGTPDGRLTGIFLIASGVFNFLLGFLKETQAPFESTMSLNMGQIISIVMFLLGTLIFYLSIRKTAVNK
jgi:prolipoprotein diacylglyceryltransferase